MTFIQGFKCDLDWHTDKCPLWCDLRPGGATKEPPYGARATITLRGDHAFKSSKKRGICECGQFLRSRVHGDYPPEA